MTITEAKKIAMKMTGEGYSQREIAKALTAQGMTTPRGKPLCQSAVSRMLLGKYKTKAKGPGKVGRRRAKPAKPRQGATSGKRELADAIITISMTKMDLRTKRKVVEAML